MQNVNRFPSSKLKLDEFFLNWLSSPESQKLVRPIPTPTTPSPTVGCRQLSCRPRHARDLPTRVRRLARETLPEPRPPPPLPPTMFIL